MTPLIFASAMALFRATLSSDDPLFSTTAAPGAAHPVNGVWAALPADCARPTSLDLSTWPKCATPVGFLDGELAALQKTPPNSARAPDAFYAVARTHFWLIPGSPDIVQVDVPIMFNHSTVYIAVEPDSVDPSGGFTAATGWPIGCPPAAVPGVVLDGGRCTASTPGGVEAAAKTPPSPDKTYRLVRIVASAEPPPVPSTAAESPVEPMAADGSPGASAVPPPAVEPPQPGADTPPATPPTARPGDVGEAPLPPPGASSAPDSPAPASPGPASSTPAAAQQSPDPAPPAAPVSQPSIPPSTPPSGLQGP
jgi:hypothetical protein